jgi:hypothetical protein
MQRPSDEFGSGSDLNFEALNAYDVSDPEAFPGQHCQIAWCLTFRVILACISEDFFSFVMAIEVSKYFVQTILIALAGLFVYRPEIRMELMVILFILMMWTRPRADA